MIPREELFRVKRIASKINPRVKEWAALTDRKGRELSGATLAEGAKLAAEGLSAPEGGPLAPLVLLVSDTGAEHRDAGALFNRAGEMGLERISLADDCFAKISGLKNSDGLALVLSFAAPERLSADMWTHPGARWLVAAGVQDPGNAGALARTALAAGCTGCLFLDGADPLSPKFLRGSMGAAFRIPCLAGSADEFAGVWTGGGGATLVVAATSGDAREHYCSIDYRPPMALLIGGERGVPPELSRLADRHAHIPLDGGVESLNLAVAAGVILFEARRQDSASRTRE